jgi:hypothetical protein
VGASKSGTTSMHNILKQHSEIFLPDVKETHFFHKNFEKGIDWYQKFFENTQKQRAIGEICPTYLYNPFSASRIFMTLGINVKLIFILRNPADKMFSNYKMNVALFNEKSSFKEAMENDLRRIKTNEEYPVAFHYVKKGFYYEQISRFLKFYPIENMLFLIYETDFGQNSINTYKRIQRFLGVNNEELYTKIHKIPGQNVKLKSLDKLLNSPNWINRSLKWLIPNKQIRTRIKNILIEKNNKEILVDSSQFNELKDYIIKEIYLDDIKKLEETISLDLKIWYI